MTRVFCKPNGVPLRLLVHDSGDLSAGPTNQRIMHAIAAEGGAVVSSLEDAQCVIISDPGEESALKLQKELALSCPDIPVLQSKWVFACIDRRKPLGPKDNPEWGGYLLKYYFKAEEYFNDHVRFPKKEAGAEVLEYIDLTVSSDDDDLEEHFRSPTPKVRSTRRRRLLREPSDVPGTKPAMERSQQSIADILSAISERSIKYTVQDLAVYLEKVLETPERSISQIAEVMQRCRGGVMRGWRDLWQRHKAELELCVRRANRGDETYRKLLPNQRGSRGISAHGPKSQRSSQAHPAIGGVPERRASQSARSNAQASVPSTSQPQVFGGSFSAIKMGESHLNAKSKKPNSSYASKKYI